MKWLSGIAPLLFTLTAFAGACDKEQVSLQVLGSGGPELQDGRASSSYLVWRGDKAVVMVDTGPGSSVAFGASGARFEDLHAVALTHLHVDHSGDLPAFVKGAFFTPRRRDLPVYGPGKNALMPATSEFVERLFGPNGVFPYLADNVDPKLDGDFVLRASDVPVNQKDLRIVHDKAGIRLLAMPVHHGPVAAVAWRVEVGGCVIGFSGDMSNQWQQAFKLFQQADALVMHNAIAEPTFGVARRLHMPPSEIGKIAHKSGATKVILSHRMRRSLGKEQQTLKAISAHYAGSVEFAEDGQRFALADLAAVVVD